MDKEVYENHKRNFINLTGMVANDNLEVFMSYLNLLVSMGIKDRLTILVENDRIRLNDERFKR